MSNYTILFFSHWYSLGEQNDLNLKRVTTSKRVLCNRPTLMKGPMQTYHCATFTHFLGQDSSNDASQLPRTHMLVASESILKLGLGLKFQGLGFDAMENRPLVTDEPVEFEK